MKARYIIKDTFGHWIWLLIIAIVVGICGGLYIAREMNASPAPKHQHEYAIFKDVVRQPFIVDLPDGTQMLLTEDGWSTGYFKKKQK